jgi:hypothetical protein
MNALAKATAPHTAVIDPAHIGHINGAFGTIRQGDHGPRESWRHRLQTLLAILGPGLIVMVSDNDAGAFGTYTQAGQNYGTALLWTLLLLVPVLYVNQEMVPLRSWRFCLTLTTKWLLTTAAAIPPCPCEQS